MEKQNKLVIALCVLITVVLVLFILNYKKHYSSLKEAVTATSRGGSIEEKFPCSHGDFVLIEGSNVMTSGYYYQENNKWYYDSNTVKKNYQLEEDLNVSVYYYPNQDVSIVEIIEIKDAKITDIEETEFKEKKKHEGQYIGVIPKELTRGYRITINEKEYKLTAKM